MSGYFTAIYLDLTPQELAAIADNEKCRFMSKSHVAEDRDYMRQQRDELVAALIHIQQVACSGSPELGIATEALAKWEGK